MSVSESTRPNELELNVTLDVRKCIAVAPPASSAAIDEFEALVKALIVRAAESKDDPQQIRLLLLGLVSSCENYFRQLLTALLAACPLCKDKCARIEVKYASATYFSADEISQALTDGSVFSSAENIVTETKRLTGLNPEDSGSVKAALSEFHKVCVLRHAAVHSYGDLGGKNIVDLGLDADKRMMVALTWEAFQEICDVCQNFVRAYNGFMWRAVVGRLRERSKLLFDGSDVDKELFERVQRVFWTAVRMNDAGADAYLAFRAA